MTTKICANPSFPYCNVYSTPNTASEYRPRHLLNGAVVEVLSIEGPMAHIRWNGSEGYVYVTLLKDVPSSPASPLPLPTKHLGRRRIYGQSEASRVLTSSSPSAPNTGDLAPSTGAGDEPFQIPAWYSILSTVGVAAGAYHGYKRNNSIGWAIGWAMLGGLFPFITVPVALAQGFGKRQTGSKR